MPSLHDYWGPDTTDYLNKGAEAPEDFPCTSMLPFSGCAGKTCELLGVLAVWLPPMRMLWYILAICITCYHRNTTLNDKFSSSTMVNMCHFSLWNSCHVILIWIRGFLGLCVTYFHITFMLDLFLECYSYFRSAESVFLVYSNFW